MSSETNFTRVNVFPSQTSYNNNKGSLGAGELSIVPLPDLLRFIERSTSSIISSELRATQSGVRLGIQCGTYTRDGTTKTITFPVPFSDADAYNFFVKYDGDEYQEQNKTNTSIQISTVNANNEKGEWVAFGYLQGSQ